MHQQLIFSKIDAYSNHCNLKENLVETYFGKINLEEFADVDPMECFKHNGLYYWYKLIVEDDEFKLLDTCGRMVPFHMDVANEFATMGFIVGKYYDAQREAAALVEKRMDQLQQLVKFWEANE